MLTCGRLKLRATSRSASSWASVLDLICDPRSAWRTSVLGATPSLSTVSAMRSLALAALSSRAIIQPTTFRLKMSRTTYR